MTNKNEVCCQKFDPKPWDGKELIWINKQFIKARVLTFMYMPLNFGQVITKLVNKAGAAMTKDQMCLSDHTSMWNMDIYLAADKEVDGAENVKLSGKFFSKVYEGDFKDTGVWCKDYEKLVKDKGVEVKKWYMWYTTCPKCAKKYGKNYVVIVGELKTKGKTNN